MGGFLACWALAPCSHLLCFPRTQDQAILRSDVATRQEEPLSREDLVVFYDALTGKLDQLYTQLDSVFTDARLHSLDQQFADAKLLIGADLRATLQMRDVKVLPFKFETVHRVLWRHIQEESVHEGTPGSAEVRHACTLSLLEGRIDGSS